MSTFFKESSVFFSRDYFILNYNLFKNGLLFHFEQISYALKAIIFDANFSVISDDGQLLSSSVKYISWIGYHLHGLKEPRSIVIWGQMQESKWISM
jgi:hypothetical protein